MTKLKYQGASCAPFATSPPERLHWKKRNVQAEYTAETIRPRPTTFLGPYIEWDLKYEEPSATVKYSRYK